MATTAEDKAYKTRVAFYDLEVTAILKKLQGKSSSLFVEMAIKNFIQQPMGQNMVNLLLRQFGKDPIPFRSIEQPLGRVPIVEHNAPLPITEAPAVETEQKGKSTGNGLCFTETLGDFV